MLQVSCRTVRFWAECGELPSWRIGKQWRFDPCQLQEWIDARQNGGWPGRSDPGRSRLAMRQTVAHEGD